MADQPVDPQYAAQAAQAVGKAQNAGGPVDAGASIDEMTKLRAQMSDYEETLKKLLADSQAQAAQYAANIDSMQRQLTTVRAQAGPPAAQLLADSLATRVQTLAATHPDLGAQHWAGVISQAASLADEVKQVTAGAGSHDRVHQLAEGIFHWFTRVHPRISGKFLEGSHAAIDEAERIAEELGRLEPAAAAVAKAL